AYRETVGDRRNRDGGGEAEAVRKEIEVSLRDIPPERAQTAVKIRYRRTRYRLREYTKRLLDQRPRPRIVRVAPDPRTDHHVDVRAAIHELRDGGRRIRAVGVDHHDTRVTRRANAGLER